jgi:hypothetical protein
MYRIDRYKMLEDKSLLYIEYSAVDDAHRRYMKWIVIDYNSLHVSSMYLV